MLWKYVYTRSVVRIFFLSWMKCFTDAALHIPQNIFKVVKLWCHNGQKLSEVGRTLLCLFDGFSFKVNCFFGLEGVNVKIILAENNGISFMGAAGAGLLCKRITVVVVTPHKMGW